MELNKIYNEDCFETMSSKIDNNSIDIVLTSPPYNMTKRKGGNADTGRYDVYKDWLTEDEYKGFTERLFNEYDRIIKPNGIVLYNLSYSIENPSLPYKVVVDIEEKTNWRIVESIVWKKKNGMPFPANERRLSRMWEMVYVFARKDEMNSYTCHKGISSIGKNGQKYYNVFYNIFEAKNNDGFCKLNQATYSTEFCEKLLSVYGEKGSIVYDSFIGTGTTAIACINKEMFYIGSELSKSQCEYSEERIKKL